jgi:AraC-like DNA-binding protein
MLSHADVALLSTAAECHLRIPGGFPWLAMSLAPEDLAAAGHAVAGRELRAPPVTRLLRPPGPLLARLRNLHGSACDLAATAPDILHHSEVGRAMEQELIRTMVACLASDDSVGAVRDVGKRAPVMRRFERALEEHEGEPLYLLELCAQIGVSDRQLRLYCQEQLGMSPHRYLWLRRMHMARRALALAHDSTSTVTSIATGHGFGELGRFAVQYRRLFGESPSATLARSPDEPKRFLIEHLPASVSA